MPETMSSNERSRKSKASLRSGSVMTMSVAPTVPAATASASENGSDGSVYTVFTPPECSRSWT